VGLGNGPSVFHSLPADAEDELAIDLSALRGRLLAERAIGRGVIVTYGLGEVNTGGFGRGLPQVAAELRHLVEGIDMADSLTLDGHKWLNVPYDCGLFFTRDARALPSFLGPSAANTPAYLAADPADIPSPLTVNIENSRRFRALPLFASLLSLGKEGYADIVRRNVAFARRVATYVAAHPSYQLLNMSPEWLASGAPVPLNIVLFRGAPGSRFDPEAGDAHTRLTAAINATRRMYVTGTQWGGKGAVRLAVSNWRTGEADWDIVQSVLDEVMA
jgi:glutamate/tyrosine decarboxylase-like PLP-dependent enzyme